MINKFRDELSKQKNSKTIRTQETSGQRKIMEQFAKQ